MTLLNSGLIVFLGGGCGAVLRWTFSNLAMFIGLGAWTGTLFSNVLGCLLIFLFSKLLPAPAPELSLLVKVGILGGLTTFSGFALEVVSAYLAGRYHEFFLILGLNIILGIIIGLVVLR